MKFQRSGFRDKEYIESLLFRRWRRIQFRLPTIRFAENESLQLIDFTLISFEQKTFYLVAISLVTFSAYFPVWPEFPHLGLILKRFLAFSWVTI